MQIVSINVGKAVPLFVPTAAPAADGQRQVMSGIRKKPVSTLAAPAAVLAGPFGLAGDEQADHSVHGGRDKAVYAYPLEHYSVWRTLRMQATGIDAELPHGSFGENLTIAGLLETGVWTGDVLAFGASAVRMRIASPRSPCFKFNAVMGFRQASQMMVQSGFTGFYLEVLQGGTISAGDPVQLIPGERHLQMRILDLHRMKTSGKQRPLF